MPRYNGGFIGTDGLDAPDPPTDVTPTAGAGSLSIAFTAPTDTGTSAITGFVAQVSTDGTAYSAGSGTGTSSPITISSLTAGTSYTAKVWAINAYGTSAPSDASSSVAPVIGRAIFAGGTTGSRQNVIDYITIGSTGNAQDFGDLSQNRQMSPGLISSTTRSVFTAGISDAATYEDTMDYVTIATTGNSSDFGNLSVARFNMGSCSSVTRGITFNGVQQSGTSNTIDYITIASTGNATDFGDMNTTVNRTGGSSSPTRGIQYGGQPYKDEISYITIASTGDAADFGNLTEGRSDAAGCSSNTRICMCAGSYTGLVSTIDYITTASTGNATDFGDINTQCVGPAGASNRTRGVIAGGDLNGSYTNVIDYITIANTGNATDFGDLTLARRAMTSGSDSHGGI